MSWYKRLPCVNTGFVVVSSYKFRLAINTFVTLVLFVKLLHFYFPHFRHKTEYHITWVIFVKVLHSCLLDLIYLSGIVQSETS